MAITRADTGVVKAVATPVIALPTMALRHDAVGLPRGAGWLIPAALLTTLVDVPEARAPPAAVPGGTAGAHPATLLVPSEA